jgi:hypothetical protein
MLLYYSGALCFPFVFLGLVFSSECLGTETLEREWLPSTDWQKPTICTPPPFRASAKTKSLGGLNLIMNKGLTFSGYRGTAGVATPV